jgi:hypothetical protein
MEKTSATLMPAKSNAPALSKVELPKLPPATPSPALTSDPTTPSSEKNDPDQNDIITQQLAERERRQKELEQSIQNLPDLLNKQLAQATSEEQLQAIQQQSKDVQTMMQNDLAELSLPPQAPTDLGEMEFANGVATTVQLNSGRNATLTLYAQGNSLMAIISIRGGLNLNRFPWGAAKSMNVELGQPNTIMIGDEFLKFTPNM